MTKTGSLSSTKWGGSLLRCFFRRRGGTLRWPDASMDVVYTSLDSTSLLSVPPQRNQGLQNFPLSFTAVSSRNVRVSRRPFVYTERNEYLSGSSGETCDNVGWIWCDLQDVCSWRFSKKRLVVRGWFPTRGGTLGLRRIRTLFEKNVCSERHLVSEIKLCPLRVFQNEKVRKSRNGNKEAVSSE